MNQRGHASARPDPGAFRCLVCQSYVTGTPAGHCPRCGFVPPSAPSVPEPGAGLPPALRRAVLLALAVGIAAALAIINQT
jgi:hypothetical protein